MQSSHEDYVGRVETAEDVAAAGPYRRLAALLDHADWPWAPGVAPNLGHWLNFLPLARQSDIGADGHPKRGGFLPPVALPRRMWAGSRTRFLAPMPLEAPIRRRSQILSVEDKVGRSGRMTFVAVRHEIFAADALVRTEDQDVVYREDPGPAAPAEAEAEPRPIPGEVLRLVLADETLLFRYSALTFNAHRIHYDRPYAQGVEGYPGLVVHGPLAATLLLDAFERTRPQACVTGFDFRAERPLFAGDPAALVLVGEASDSADLAVYDSRGRRTLVATARLG